MLIKYIFYIIVNSNSVPALIRSNYPINKKYGLYYFEIEILSVDLKWVLFIYLVI